MSKELSEIALSIARKMSYNDDTLQAEAKHTLIECALRIRSIEGDEKRDKGSAIEETS